MIKQGTLPLAQKDKAIAAIQSGGKTVDELTGKLFSFRFIKIYFLTCLVYTNNIIFVVRVARGLFIIYYEYINYISKFLIHMCICIL